MNFVETRPTESHPPTETLDSEVLMRKFVHDGLYDPSCTPPVKFGAFVPNKNDLTGISMSILHRQFHSESEFLQTQQNPNVRTYGGVLTLIAHQMRGIGLTIISSPTTADCGHVSIKEININDYNASTNDKRKIQEIATKLAEMCTVKIEPKKIPPNRPPEL